MITREQQAGNLYSEGCKAVRTGGLELHTLAMHLILMIKGTTEYPGQLWRKRELPGGSMRELDRFIDYLLLPVRDGLELPSLYFLKQTLEATVPAKDGDRALAMVRSELASEHVDFDKQAKLDEMKLHGEREPQPELGTNQYSGCDNITPKTQRGTSSAYLAGVLKRDFPEIAERLANGEFRSVRAAAIAAGIITPLTPLEQILKLLPKLSEDDRAELRRQL